ncbi:MAG TPA: phosphatase PAP2 family protein [Pirellulales bacterium]|nr:phosphatase PAP2 family protein [Pirellulales bacterium]
MLSFPVGAGKHRSAAPARIKQRSYSRCARFEQLEPRAMMAASTDAILYWNAIALQAEADDKSNIYGSPDAVGPTGASRALAIVSVAMYDAINSIEGQYEPYLIKVVGVQNANIDAAVGQAAHDALVNVYHKQTTVFDTDLSTRLGQIADGADKNLGIALGKTVANAILSVRANDRSNVMMNYHLTDAPGHHQPDPLHPNQGILSPDWGKVTPFGINNVNNFNVPPPPVLNSQAYTDAYNQVMSLGAADSTTRTAEETDIGIFWAYDGTPGLGTPPRFYNQIARVLAQQEGNTEYQNARMFAMINVALADAGIACWNVKYKYDFWRPIVAIRDGANDGNPNTVGDPTWTPLGAPATNGFGDGVNFTPPFPSYDSGHATFGGALFETLARFYGTDNITFTISSDEFNGINKNGDGSARQPFGPLTFTSFSAAAEENAMSRVYLGIHWIFDAQNGVAQGDKIADYDFNHIFQPLNQPMPSSSGSHLFAAYLKTVLQTTLMDFSDHAHRQVVMLQGTTNSHSTIYTVFSLQPLYPTPGSQGHRIYSQTIYAVDNNGMADLTAPNLTLLDDLLAAL